MDTKQLSKPGTVEEKWQHSVQVV